MIQLYLVGLVGCDKPRLSCWPMTTIEVLYSTYQDSHQTDDGEGTISMTLDIHLCQRHPLALSSRRFASFDEARPSN